MVIHLSTLLKFYKRPEIQKEIFLNAESREVAIKYEKGFGKRPDTIQYPADVLEFAKKKATSFHISEEIWKNPMQITTGMSIKETNVLRKGWDLVLDIDGIFEFSKIVTKLTIELLQSFKIKSVSCKFSGNKGFHIAVPFESFPKEVNGIKINELFPEAARRLAAYIWTRIEPKLAKEIMKKYNIEKLQKLTKLSFNELTEKKGRETKLKTKALVDIDTVLISNRHLYRSVYSFNEKSGLVSIPFNPDRVMKFSKIEAKPENVRVSKFRFLDKEKAKQGESKKLFEAAYDWTFDENAFRKEEMEERTRKDNPKRNYDADELAEAIPEEYFPPCIKVIFEGLSDGKKRSLFILVNFLTSVGWDYEGIEERLKEWNEKNNPQLREGIIKNHIRYHKQNKKKVLPPNCNNEAYYLNIGICKPDPLCSRIKNPVNYAKIKFKRAGTNSKKKKSSPVVNRTDDKSKDKISK